ncbi:MAG: hypothetical protein NWE89_06050 [Candidatus Bathyarchaeota archaeon]|nr:hypothetical protein [Candidatus Bathyarchaeota archaeon]
MKKKVNEKKRKDIITNLSQTNINLKEARKKQDAMKRVLNDITPITEELIQKNYAVIDVLRHGGALNHNEYTRGTLNHMETTAFSVNVQSNNFLNNMGKLSENLIYIHEAQMSTLTSFGSTLSTGLISIAPSFENQALIQERIDDINTPSFLDRKNELIEILMKIDQSFIEELEGTWIAYHSQNPSNHVQAASSMRKLVYNILGKLGPERKVQSVKGYISERNDGSEKPTWGQRASYAMIGINQNLTDEEMELVLLRKKEVSKNIYDLNLIAKKRNVQKGLKDFIYKTLDDTQITLLDIFQKRDLYFHELKS